MSQSAFDKYAFPSRPETQEEMINDRWMNNGLTRRELFVLEVAKAWRIANPTLGTTDLVMATVYEVNALIKELDK